MSTKYLYHLMAYNLLEKEMKKIRMIREFRYQREIGEGKSIMIWALIDQDGIIEMVWVNQHAKKLNSEHYNEEVLTKHVLNHREFQKGSR